MYWYYFQAARGIRIWWKEWITRLQIAQFVIDLGMFPTTRRFPLALLSPGSYGSPWVRLMLDTGFVYYATYNYYIDKHIPSLPHVGTCGGEEFAAFTGCATLSSYLVLFISFYAATYKKASAKDKRSTMAMSTRMPSKAVHELERKKMPTMIETSETAVEALHCAEGLMKAAGTSIVSTSHELHLIGGGNK